MTEDGIERSEIERLIGAATMTWNEVHSYFFMAFLDCAGLDLNMAKAIYFNLTSDRAQRALAHTVVEELAGADSPHVKNFAKLVRKADKIATKRNAAVHQIWDMHGPDHDGVVPNRTIHLHKALQDDFVSVLRGLDRDIGGLYIDILEWNRTSFDDLTAIYNARFQPRTLEA